MILNKWHQKTVYVIGWISVVFIVISIVFGIISAAVQDGQQQAIQNQYTTN